MSAPAPAELIDALSAEEVLDVLGPSDADDMGRRATLAKAAAFPTVNVLEGDAPAPPAMLVERLLLDRDVNIFGGPGGAGKSIVLLTVAVHVALGTDCFGTLPVTRSGPVVIVSPEDGTGFVRMALDAIILGMGLDEAQRATLAARLVMVADDQLVNLATDTNRLKHTVQAVGAVLLILDPLRNVLPAGEEMNNDLAGLVLDQLRRDVCREAGCTVAISHHHRKRSREQHDTDAGTTTDDLRGASAWGAGSRLVYAVAKADTSRTIRLTATKSNRLRAEDLRHELALTIVSKIGNPAAWTALTLHDADDGLSVSLTPGVGRPLKESERAALRVLEDEPDTALSWSAWRARAGLPERTFSNCKARLQKAGLAESVPTGKRAPGGGQIHVYRITPAGRNALLGGPVAIVEEAA